jgi:hypothetical protein
MTSPTSLHRENAAFQRHKPLKVTHIGLDQPADVRAPDALNDCGRRSTSVKLAESAGMRELFQALLFGADGLQVA